MKEPFRLFRDSKKKIQDIPKLAHKRMYDIIKDRGVEVLKAEENPRIKKEYMVMRL